ncbi:uncharacterized protein EDB93DRAFT_246182 [Suillus bovinus]|uniref:uncharacterized protein n=1 Tax=Suillus bovinus TaxID=48563 RepID=UPI001B862A13|nr:uncharacterized protein EDB93DRAFT_246182 [Suillus bovinus]KAG2126895.1 hypothetical protein EDB93DRAFT_246182 [Suillus bovinus]
MSQLRSQLQSLDNPRPRYLVINTNPLPPQQNSLPRRLNFGTHIRMGHLSLFPLHGHRLTPWISVVFSLIIFCSIIELSISAWLTSRFVAYHNYFSLAERDRTCFLLFTSGWTIILSSVSMCFSSCPPGSVLFLTWIFWTAGATSITTALSGELIHKLVTSSFNSLLTSYFPSTQGVVYLVQLNALQGFAWVNEALVTFALLVVIIRSILTD